VIWHLIKDLDFRDNPPNSNWQAGSGASRPAMLLLTLRCTPTLCYGDD
jgi:hypothetical protein